MLALWPVTTFNLLRQVSTSCRRNLLQDGRLSYSVTRPKTQLRTRCCEGLRPDINNVLIDLRATRDTTRHKITNKFSLNVHRIVNGFVVLFHIGQLDFCFSAMNPVFTLGKECIKVWSELRLKRRNTMHCRPDSDHDIPLFGRVCVLGSW